MTEDENFKRRIHAYIAFGGIPVSLLLLAVFATLIAPFRGYRLAFVEDALQWPILVCLIPFITTGFMMRRYMPRSVSLIAGLLSPLTIIGIFWSGAFLRDWYRVNRLERMGFRQALAFCYAFPFGSTQQMARRTRSLDNEGLILAYQLPDHTPAAKSMLAREIKSRGLGGQLSTDWLPTPARSTVPPNVFRVTSAADYRNMGLSKERTFRVIRAVTITVMLLLPFLGLSYYVVTTLGFVGGQGPRLVQSFVQLLLAGPLAVIWSFVILYLSYVSLAFAIGGFYYRNHGGRVLLLRPFGHKHMTGPLKNVVWWYLAPYGHVFTLSDQNYKPNIVLDFLMKVFAYLRMIIGPVVRPSFRVGSVKTEHSYFQFADSLTQKYKLSFLSLSCGSQAFNVRSTDEWWKSCVNLLLNSCDIILMDISRISAGSAWEIERLAKTGFIKNCIFIVQESYLREGVEGLSRLLPPGVRPQVYAYRETGEMLDVNGFEIALHDSFNRSLATWGKSWTARPQQSLSTIVPVFPGHAVPKGQSPVQGVGARADYASDGVELVPLARGQQPISVGRVALFSPQGVVIGRSSDSDVVINNKSISKKHARISLTTEGLLSVEDLGSSNGTWRGKDRFNRAVFSDGDLLRLGEVDYQVRIHAPGTPPTKPAGFGGVIGQIALDLNAVAQGNFKGPHVNNAALQQVNAGADIAVTERGWLLSGSDEGGQPFRHSLRPRLGAIETVWTVGRGGPGTDLVIGHSTVSSMHARFRYSSDRGLELCDLGSQNGTRADGAPVGGNFVSIARSQTIEMGGVRVSVTQV